MKKNFKLLIYLLPIIVFSQTKNYCENQNCSLGKEDSAHFDPYFNGHLCENFNPNQKDFSKEYLDIQIANYEEDSFDVTDSVKGFNFDVKSLFLSGEQAENGVIGLDYKRIQFYIYKAKQDTENPRVFKIYGKSNVKGNICDFKGEIRIQKIIEFKESDLDLKQGNIFATYEFFEDKTQNHVGVFKGSFESQITFDFSKKLIALDDSFDSADSYFNRTYVGTWQSYKTGKIKKCIWGDYRLPFTFDFDCGDGEMLVCPKYVKNGWETFNDGSEYLNENKWWKNK
ncbi:hypothetical protein [Aureivirga sp. CE67]|uniref:hypothetical protein n=1 Tax=Aureivirga sp. CE67 TaxID=1788983 RepID=UPI0018C9E914|nr:hypothetical protein [Aureivirga sp. CE67]